MPGSIKRALVREVARRESNLNDVAVALLSERFGITFSPSGRRRKAIPGAAGAVVLRAARTPRRLVPVLPLPLLRTRTFALTCFAGLAFFAAFGAMLLGNVLWLVLAGWWLALGHVLTGIAMCLTIIGIPLGLANFKLVPVSLLPLGKDVVAF